MRLIIPIFLLILMALPCRANYNNMPSPPPGAANNLTSEETRSQVKRGIRWYRHPHTDTAAKQLKLAFTHYTAGRYRKAANAYQALVYAWPDSPEAPQAQLALAKVQEIRELYAKAFDEYQYLFEYYPGQFDYQEVLDRQFKIANYMMKTPKGAFLFFPGFEAPERALPMYERLIKNAPSGSQAATAQLNIGIIHETNEEEEDAVSAYEIVQNRYGDVNLAAQAAFREAHCLVKLHTLRPNDEDACNAARAALVQFITTYPGDAQVERAKGFLKTLNDQQAKRAYDLARYYQTIARRPKAAIVAFEDYLRKFPNTALAPSAKAQLDLLNKDLKTNEKK